MEESPWLIPTVFVFLTADQSSQRGRRTQGQEKFTWTDSQAWKSCQGYGKVSLSRYSTNGGPWLETEKPHLRLSDVYVHPLTLHS